MLVGLWSVVAALGLFRESLFPRPMDVARGLVREVASGRLLNDTVASLYRVCAGFYLAVVLGVPLGLLVGQFDAHARGAAADGQLLPQPVAAGMDSVRRALVRHRRSASHLPDLHGGVLPHRPLDQRRGGQHPERRTSGWGAISACRAGRCFREVTLPAIAPQIITALRITAGLSWLVVVAAEMLAGTDGLGFAVWDARNGLRVDLLAAAMVTIGLLGVLIDKVLVRLTLLPSVRWGYER